MPSTVAGKVSELRVKAGDKVKVGQVVLVVENGQGAAAQAVAPPKQAAAPVAPAAAKEPELANASEPEETASPAAKSGPVPAGAPAPSPKTSAGNRPEGRPAEVVNISSARPAASTAPQSARTDAAPAGDSASAVAAAPSVRRFARELGVNIGDVAGTGPGGRRTSRSGAASRSSQCRTSGGKLQRH